MTKHTEPHRILVTIKQGSEPLSVLMTAFVGDVTKKNGVPALTFKLFQVVFNELQLIVWIAHLIPKELVVPVTALSVQRKDTSFQVRDVLRVVAMLVPTFILRHGNPLPEFCASREGWANRIEVPLVLRESIVVTKGNSQIPTTWQKLVFYDSNNFDKLLVYLVLRNKWIIVRCIVARPEKMVRVEGQDLIEDSIHSCLRNITTMTSGSKLSSLVRT